MSETSFFRRCNAPLEKSFTVVYWDQRGAGKSYDRIAQSEWRRYVENDGDGLESVERSQSPGTG